MDNFDYLSSTEPAVIEQLYEQFKTDPSSVEDGWRKFFEGFDFAVQDVFLHIGKNM